MISMPYSTNVEFDEEELVKYVLASGRDYIALGGQNVMMKDHGKPSSLDYWLRSKNSRDTLCFPKETSSTEHKLHSP